MMPLLYAIITSTKGDPAAAQKLINEGNLVEDINRKKKNLATSVPVSSSHNFNGKECGLDLRTDKFMEEPKLQNSEEKNENKKFSRPWMRSNSKSPTLGEFGELSSECKHKKHGKKNSREQTFNSLRLFRCSNKWENIPLTCKNNRC